MAYGRLGWTEERLNNCTDLKIFELALKGFNNLEEERQKAEWERLRILGTWVLAPYSKNLTPMKLMPLPWDVKRTREQFYKENKELIPIWDKLSHG